MKLKKLSRPYIFFICAIFMCTTQNQTHAWNWPRWSQPVRKIVSFCTQHVKRNKTVYAISAACTAIALTVLALDKYLPNIPEDAPAPGVPAQPAAEPAPPAPRDIAPMPYDKHSLLHAGIVKRNRTHGYLDGFFITQNTELDTKITEHETPEMDCVEYSIKTNSICIAGASVYEPLIPFVCFIDQAEREHAERNVVKLAKYLSLVKNRGHLIQFFYCRTPDNPEEHETYFNNVARSASYHLAAHSDNDILVENWPRRLFTWARGATCQSSQKLSEIIHERLHQRSDCGIQLADTHQGQRPTYFKRLLNLFTHREHEDEAHAPEYVHRVLEGEHPHRDMPLIHNIRTTTHAHIEAENIIALMLESEQKYSITRNLVAHLFPMQQPRERKNRFPIVMLPEGVENEHPERIAYSNDRRRVLQQYQAARPGAPAAVRQRALLDV